MRPRKRFGQHFLVPDWADKLVAAIGPRPDDRFLEIGPGTGVLTERLAPLVEHLTAVEVDRDLTTALALRLPANVTLIEADFLAVDLEPILAERGRLRVAGNLPYNVASPILFRIVEAWTARVRDPSGGHRATRQPAEGPWKDATLMVQREVADRILAQPGSRDYGPLSIAIQLHADAARVLALPPGAFRPAPSVYSTVIHLAFRAPAVVVRDEQAFGQMVRSMFTQRRKMLGNSLAPFAARRGTDARTALTASGIDPRRRAETLDLSELARLADFFAGA